MLLFAVAAIDELASGVPSTGAPEIEHAFGLSHAATAVVTFVGPGAVSLVFDPVVFWLAERFGRPRMIRIGLAAIALGSFLAAAAPGPISLCLALALWHLAAGAATGLTEATLLDAWPERQAQTMARWTLLGLVGDFAGPALLGGLAVALGRTASTEAWRVAFAVVGVIVATWAVALCLRPFPPAAIAPDDDEPSLWQAARDAIRDAGLMVWLFGVALCDLLDEVLIVFASLRLRELGASPAWQSAAIAAFLAGGAIGLVALERVVARPGTNERRLLIACGTACTVSFLAWLAAPSLAWSAIALVPVGATAAPLYPLASAQAFARRPGRAGVVMVASHLFAPIALALPGVLGVIADRAGLTWALVILTAQPVGLVILAVTTGGRGNRDSRTGDAP